MAKKAEESKNLNIEEIKEDLNDYIDTKIKKEIDKNYKKLIRVKNKSILFKNILIIIMAFIIVYLLYLLKEADYFDKYFLNDNVESNIVVDKSKVNIVDESKENLKDKYSYLLDNIIISENSDYLDEYYKGTLSSNLKKYITLNLIDLNDFLSDDYIVIDSEKIKEQYEKVFDSNFEDSDFKYNGNTLKYIKKINAYISEKVFQNEISNIKREIINIEEKNSKIYITTLEAIVKDDRVYNILTKEKLGHYNKSLNEYKDKIDIVKYEFSDEKLIKIEV